MIHFRERFVIGRVIGLVTDFFNKWWYIKRRINFTDIPPDFPYKSLKRCNFTLCEAYILKKVKIARFIEARNQSEIQ